MLKIIKSYFRKYFLSFEGSKYLQNNFSTYTVSKILPDFEKDGGLLIGDIKIFKHK